MTQIQVHTQQVERAGGWHYFQVPLPENACSIEAIAVTCNLVVTTRSDRPTTPHAPVGSTSSVELAKVRVAGFIRMVRPDHGGAFFNEQVTAPSVLPLPEIAPVGLLQEDSWSRLKDERYFTINMPVTASFLDVIYKDASGAEAGYQLKIYLKYQTVT